MYYNQLVKLKSAFGPLQYGLSTSLYVISQLLILSLKYG